MTIDGAGKSYTGQMKLTDRADITIKNVNFDGKGYNGYAVEARGAYYLTVEDCTAKNYGYGFVQLASGTVKTTVKNVTISDMNYGVKVDYSSEVVLENVDITAAVAAVLNSNYGEKTVTIKDSDLNILGTWTRNDTIKTTYVFEGENSVDEFIIEAALDSFKLATEESTLTAPNEIVVTTDVEGCEVEYENGVYKVVKALFTLAGANLAVYSSLKMFFYVNNADLTGEGYYAVITREFADGSVVEEKIPYSGWSKAGSAMMRFGFDEIAAKEMTDDLTVVIYNDKDEQVSKVWNDSIEDYAVRILTTSNDTELITALVDMLNYGAAAQNHFGYNTGDLANARIDAYQKYASQSVEYTDKRVAGDNYAGSTVIAENSLMLTLYFRNITTDMTAKVTYTDHYGTAKEITVSGKDFIKNGKLYGIATDLAVADGRQMVTCEIIDANGNVAASATDSIESYVARMSNTDKVFELLMKFVQSAYNYFH